MYVNSGRGGNYIVVALSPKTVASTMDALGIDQFAILV